MKNVGQRRSNNKSIEKDRLVAEQCGLSLYIIFFFSLINIYLVLFKIFLLILKVQLLHLEIVKNQTYLWNILSVWLHLDINPFSYKTVCYSSPDIFHCNLILYFNFIYINFCLLLGNSFFSHHSTVGTNPRRMDW
ncbi:MAG: hypothetical protein ACTSQP_18410 [Promethearchaeota archaeon]